MKLTGPFKFNTKVEKNLVSIVEEAKIKKKEEAELICQSRKCLWIVERECEQLISTNYYQIIKMKLNK